MDEARLPLEDLTALVEQEFRRRANGLGLNASAIEARYRLNWGGFVNASFTVGDGQTFYHLKLADDLGDQDSLARWLALRAPLEARYHAPRIIDWVSIPGSEFAGLLFEHIEGSPVDLAEDAEMRAQVLALLARLHADKPLAELLLADRPPGSCWEYFLDVYIDRFDEDLRVVAGAPPPFVTPALLDWMMGETRELEGLARDGAAFQVPAGAPVHGDLWANNILVTSAGDWRIIDWDDLGPGDPALEYGIVLGALWRMGRLPLAQIEALLPEDPLLRERFVLCLRAYLLDEVIDPLADWVESDFAPEHQAEVRAEKQRVHQSALALYRKRFAS